MAFVSFKDYINENDITKLIVQTGVDSKGLDNPLTIQAINAQLARTTCDTFITPYVGLGAIARVLAYANIILPQYTFLDNDEGEVVFDATQIGKLGGINMDGSPADVEPANHFVYFSYEMDDNGFYDVFAAVVNTSELEELMTAEEEDEEEAA